MGLLNNFGGFMLRHFLNLRKRLLIRQLMMPAAFVAASAHAELGMLDQVMQPSFNPASYEMIFQQQVKFEAETYQNVMASRGLNKVMASRLWDMSPSDLMSLNFTTVRQDIASPEQMAAFGITSQNSQKAQVFLKILKAIQKKNPSFMSDEKIGELAKLLANGQTPMGDLFIDSQLLAGVHASADSFDKAQSPDAMAKAMADFNQSLGDLKNQTSSEVSSLLASTHGALSDALQDPEPSFEIAATSGEEFLPSESPELQFDALDNGDLFSDLNLQNEFMIEGAEANKLASNSWVTPTNVDSVVARIDNSSGAAVRNAVSIEGPASGTEAATQGTGVSTDSFLNRNLGTTVASATTLETQKANHGKDEAIQKRLNALTTEMNHTKSKNSGELTNSTLFNKADHTQNSAKTEEAAPSTEVSPTKPAEQAKVEQPKDSMKEWALESSAKFAADTQGLKGEDRETFIAKNIEKNRDLVYSDDNAHTAIVNNQADRITRSLGDDQKSADDSCPTLAVDDMVPHVWAQYQKHGLHLSAARAPKVVVLGGVNVAEQGAFGNSVIGTLAQRLGIDAQSGPLSVANKVAEKVAVSLSTHKPCWSPRDPKNLSDEEELVLNRHTADAMTDLFLNSDNTKITANGCPKEGLYNDFETFVASQLEYEARFRKLIRSGDDDDVTWCSKGTTFDISSLQKSALGKVLAKCHAVTTHMAPRFVEKFELVAEQKNLQQCLQYKTASLLMKNMGVDTTVKTPSNKVIAGSHPTAHVK